MSSWLRFAVRVFLAVFVLTGSWAWAGPNVLLLWDDDEGTTVPSGLNANTQSLIAALTTAGINVTLPAHTQGKYTGSNPSPEGFDVVVHLNGGGQYSYVLPVTAVNRLVFYVQTGHGGYVGSENNAAQLDLPVTFGGLPQEMWDLTPIDRTSGLASDSITLITILGQGGHPVLQGIPTSFPIVCSHKVGPIKDYTTDPATALMNDNAGNAAVAVRDFGTGRVVGFHHGGNDGGSSTLSDANIQRLYVNAVLWADKTPPTVKAISRTGASPTVADTIDFRVDFSEGVTGVTADSFAVVLTGEAQYTPPITLTPVSDRQYTVHMEGISGTGTIGLNLVDGDNILDESVSQNALGGAGTGNGDFTGEVYSVDHQAPRLTDLSAGASVITLGSTPTLLLTFDEDMLETVAPKVTITTAAHGDILASSLDDGGYGSWHDTNVYSVPFDRAVQAADEGVATVKVSVATDLVGNVMAPDASQHLVLIKTGLHFVSTPDPVIYTEVGGRLDLVAAAGGGFGSVAYEWFRQSEAKDFISVGGNTTVLTLSPLTLADSGIYYCVATDDFSSVQTEPTSLHVVAALPWGGAVGFAALALALVVLSIRRSRRA